MAIPDYQSLMLPILKLSNENKTLDSSVLVSLISDQFNLTEKERLELLPSGKQAIINNRIGWAKTYLKKAGLVESPQRGIIQLTNRGMMVLEQHPKHINVQYLRQFEEFADFVDTSAQSQENVSVSFNQSTPEEILESTFQQLKNQLISDMLEKIKSCSPQFFEKLVVDVIVKMGYGGSHKEAGHAIGKSGDEGIDGIINEDRLGLDVIYLQAKRWEGNIGRPEIQKFAGALQGKRAKKGVFITTSDYTAEARGYVKNLDARIILISGCELAELMWDFNVALNSAANYEIKKLDMEYFNERTD